MAAEKVSDVYFYKADEKKVTGPKDYTLKSMSKRCKVAITLHDAEGDPERKFARVMGPAEGVDKVVASIRELTGPLPLLAGVPVPHSVMNRLRVLDADAPQDTPDRRAETRRLRALGSYSREAAAAWATERRAAMATASLL